MDGERKAQALLKFERVTAVPMLVLALLIVPLLVLPLLFDLSAGERSIVVGIEWLIWGVFVAEYAIRFYLAPHKLTFIRNNKLDLIIIVLPFLRPLRVLRAARATVFLARFATGFKRALSQHHLNYVITVTGVVVVAAGFLVYSFERNVADTTITTIPDGIWWAVTTITTVGYGDTFPRTAAGRGVGIALMVVGIALFSFVAGSLASFFVEQREEQDVEPKLSEIAERLDRIEAQLDRTMSGPDPRKDL